jgi:intracellular sulfur oxidation DsrE/DsrF family protein
MADLSTVASTKRGENCSFWWLLRRAGTALLLILLAGLQSAFASDEIEALLSRDEAPYGIVFEIVEGDEAALTELLPRVRSAIQKIRARFPQTEFAVVSHGREEFALQRKHEAEYAQIHRQVQSLVADDVPVHVCETHAGWYGVSAQDFPEYVNVAPTGPGQIRLYQELGYDLITMDSSN